MSDYYDLGPHTRMVTTASADAQLWFDRGLNWTYAFNHEEAIRCFERALEHDPNCAMAHWGIAYAIGPNYNKPWEAFDEADLKASLARAHEESARAADLAVDGDASRARPDHCAAGPLSRDRNRWKTARRGTMPMPTQCARSTGSTATISISRRSLPRR